MEQDYSKIPDSQIEAIEKSSLRMVVQALQEYSREAKDIFDRTYASSEGEVIVLAEDLVQYALEVAETYPINKRFAGFIDYKRVRWIPTPFGLFPQALLVDAKASTESNRDTLQQSQLPMDAEFRDTRGVVHAMQAGVPPHLEIEAADGKLLHAISTSIFIHYYYERLPAGGPKLRDLKSIFVLSLPHGRLKAKYNPNPDTTFFGQGKHSPARGEAARIRVYFSRLRGMCPWRLQELRFSPDDRYSAPLWRDGEISTEETLSEFSFIGR
jgi:hypothetical protein